MERGVIEPPSRRGDCACSSGASLAVLQDVQRAYEERLALVDRIGGPNKLQKQVEVLQSWVADVVAQNTLLSRTVEELEKEITTRLLRERARYNEARKHDETPCECGELKMANEALKQDNLEQEREIRRLIEEINGYQHKVDTLLKDIAFVKNITQHEKQKRECGIITDMCNERKEMAVEHVSYGHVLFEEANKCQERIQELEISLKSSSENTRALRKVNVALSEELHALRRVCAALDEQCRAATLRSHFKDDIIREMRRQLKQAKTKVIVMFQQRMQDCCTMTFPVNLSHRHFPPVSHCPDKDVYSRFQDCAVGPSKSITRFKDSAAGPSRGITRFKDSAAGPSRGNTPREKNVQFKHSCKDLEHQADFSCQPSCIEMRDTWHSALLPPVSADVSEQTSQCEQVCQAEQTHACEAEEVCLEEQKANYFEELCQEEENNEFVQACCEPMPLTCSDMLPPCPNESPRGPAPQPTQVHPQSKSPLSFFNSDYFKTIKNLVSPLSPQISKGQGMDMLVEELYFNKATSDSNTSQMECQNECQNECKTTETEEEDVECYRVHTPLLESTSSLEAGASDAVRAHYFRQKFQYMLQILRNKEETLHIQAQILGEAEARIAALNARALRMRHELDSKNAEIIQLCAKSAQAQRPRACPEDAVEASIQTEPGSMYERELVRTLQSNLSIVEKLYRNCFYECAKQEELIELLRRSCVEVRQQERLKADELTRTRDTRARGHSLQRYQDLATEVENLKTEINNFLNSSNNDSGMWERDESINASDVTEDLQQIADLLTQLQTILAVDCACDSRKENQKLRMKVIKLEQQLCDAELKIAAKELEPCKCTAQQQEQIAELNTLRRTVEHFDEKKCAYQRNIANMKELLHNAEARLQEKMAELVKMQKRVAEQETTISELQKRSSEQESTVRELRCQLQNAQQAHKECGSRDCEVEQLRDAACQWRRQAAAAHRTAHGLETQLQRAKAHMRELDNLYREKVCAASALQEQLEAAQEQGVALCAEARRVVGTLRTWIGNMRATHRVQKEKITELECKVAQLKRQLSAAESGHETETRSRGAGSSRSPCGSVGPRPSVSPTAGGTGPRVSPTAGGTGPRVSPTAGGTGPRVSPTAGGTGPRVSPTAAGGPRPCGSPRPSRTAGGSPLPPHRAGCSRCARRRPRDRAAPEPPQPPCKRCAKDHTVSFDKPYTEDSTLRMPSPLSSELASDNEKELSPGQELMERVDLLQQALEESHRRWVRGRQGDNR